MTSSSNHEAFLVALDALIKSRKTDQASKSYVAQLYAKGRAKIAEKVGEEAVELVIAAIEDKPEAIAAEAADLLFHMMVLLSDAGLGLSDVIAILEKRQGVSGLTEKAARLS